MSYSAQALAAAGITPGGTVNHNNMTFTWPNAAAGTPDNVVADGQTFAISGSGSKLGFIGAATYGSASGSGLITYTDGTTQQYAIGLADWWANSAEGAGDILASFPYINGPGGKQTQKVSLYYTAVSLQAGKTVKYVTLPNVSQDASGSTTSMHIFAMAIGNGTDIPTVVSLKAHVNGKYVTAENGGAAPLIANRTAVGPWEQFDEYDFGNGTVALRAHANGNYVTADNAGASPLIANGTTIGAWQKFTLVHNADGSISLQAQVNSKYVTAPNGGNDSLIASSSAIGTPEEFDMA